MSLPDVLTPEQVAEYLQLPLDVVVTSLEQAEIPGVKIGNIWRIPQSLLMR
ncbi:MAG: helix-turn-helix domain-containing protein, partial [Anaerolineales bacterium]|nr:helix-turn-helix domain-containing protein [Anaerolineales bacterium]